MSTVTLKKTNGMYYVTVDGRTEDFRKLSTALLFIWLAQGKEVRG